MKIQLLSDTHEDLKRFKPSPEVDLIIHAGDFSKSLYNSIEHIVNFILSMAFYVTPILYTPDIFPENLSWVLEINPMAYLVNAYRSIFFYQKMPNIYDLGIVSIFSVIIFILGYFIFEKLQKGFAEEV